MYIIHKILVRSLLLCVLPINLQFSGKVNSIPLASTKYWIYDVSVFCRTSNARTHVVFSFLREIQRFVNGQDKAGKWILSQSRDLKFRNFPQTSPQPWWGPFGFTHPHSGYIYIAMPKKTVDSALYRLILDKSLGQKLMSRTLKNKTKLAQMNKMVQIYST